MSESASALVVYLADGTAVLKTAVDALDIAAAVLRSVAQ